MGGVPWVWKDSMAFRPQAWPLALDDPTCVPQIEAAGRPGCASITEANL
jgi:hypothetical protein